MGVCRGSAEEGDQKTDQQNVYLSLQAGEQNVNQVRARLLGMGSIYIAAILVAYLALGIGLLTTLDWLTGQHVPARLGALLAVLFGLWMLKDFFLPDVGWRLQAPGRVGVIARQSAKKATVPAMIVGGFLSLSER